MEEAAMAVEAAGTRHVVARSGATKQSSRVCPIAGRLLRFARNDLPDTRILLVRPAGLEPATKPL
jgi:hypothetical protein